MLWGRGRGNRTLNWQSIGLQNRRLGVRFPLPLPQSIFQWFARCRFALALLALSLNDLKTTNLWGILPLPGQSIQQAAKQCLYWRRSLLCLESLAFIR